MHTNAARAENLRKGTRVRQARAALRRAAAAGEVSTRGLLTKTTPAIAGDHQATAERMPLEAFLWACGFDAIDALVRVDALELRGYDLCTLPIERRRAIADALEETPEP